jgi:hypothetical protein
VTRFEFHVDDGADDLNDPPDLLLVSHSLLPEFGHREIW